MSLEATTRAWKYSKAVGTARFVLVALADYADDKTSIAWPSRASLARKVAVSGQTIRRAMRELEDLGEIVCIHRGTGHQTSRYRITVGPDTTDTDLDEPPASTPETTSLPDCEGGSQVEPLGDHQRPEGDEGVGTSESHQVVRGRTPRCSVDVPQNSQEQSQNSQTPSSAPSARDSDDGFDRWWSHFPRKVDKGHARKAYRSALKRTTVDELLAGVQRFAETARSLDRQFVPHAATWLNGDRWADEPAAVQASRSREPEWTW